MAGCFLVGWCHQWWEVRAGICLWVLRSGYLLQLWSTLCQPAASRMRTPRLMHLYKTALFIAGSLGCNASLCYRC